MTLTIEAGKLYNTACSKVVGPMDGPNFIGGFTAYADGEPLIWRLNGDRLFKDHVGDLISERTPPTEPAWIEWHGGECPIKSRKTKACIKFRNGEDTNALSPVTGMHWGHDMRASDIIAYRITENHEPAESVPAPIDMSQNRVPWGLLTDVEKSAILNYKGSRELYHDVRSKWIPATGFIGYDNIIFRTVAAPVITEERIDVSTANGHLVTVVLQLQDGNPIIGTVKV